AVGEGGGGAGGQQQAADQVVDRLADEHRAGDGPAEQVIPVRNGAARGGEVVGGAGVVEARQRAADGENRGGPGHRPQRHARVGRRQVRVAAQVVVFQGEVPERVAVVAAEPVAPVVAV